VTVRVRGVVEEEETSSLEEVVGSGVLKLFLAAGEVISANRPRAEEVASSASGGRITCALVDEEGLERL